MDSVPVWQQKMDVKSWLAVVHRVAKNSRPKLVAPPYKLVTLRKRDEFLAVAASGKRWVSPGFILQIGLPHAPSSMIRYGLTASRKIGNAVVRNRARRRMRAIALEIMPYAMPEHDYVLVARPTTPTHSFDDLKKDLIKGMKRLHVLQSPLEADAQ